MKSKYVTLIVIIMIVFLETSVFAAIKRLPKPTWEDWIEELYGYEKEEIIEKYEYNEYTDPEAEYKRWLDMVIRYDDTPRQIFTRPWSLVEIYDTFDASKFKPRGYPSELAGAHNYTRNNLLAMAYSLLDIDDKKPGNQSLTYNVDDAYWEGGNAYNKLGFDTSRWLGRGIGLDCVGTVRWVFNQFEPRTLAKTIKDIEARRLFEEITMPGTHNGVYGSIIRAEGGYSSPYVIRLNGENGLEQLKPGDIVIRKDAGKTDWGHIGIFVNKDENGYFCVHNASGGWHISYINTNELYAQDVNGETVYKAAVNFDYGIKMPYPGDNSHMERVR